MKFYIAWPMSGIPDMNRKEFRKAEEYLKGIGYESSSPAKNGIPKHAPRFQHMRADIEMLLDCGGVFMLNGWGGSPGARLEHEIAVQTRKTIMYQAAMKFKEIKL